MKAQYFYGHGKLLLSSEYFVTEGALALGLPTNVGQSLHVTYRPSYEPKLFWKSFDHKNQEWFSSSFELWRFRILENDCESARILQELLIQARKLNPHFLRDDLDVMIETKIEFPFEWGLGSSSTLIYNIAQWAYVSPFELCFRTQGGSGYDIACAQSMGPILYQKQSNGPKWSSVHFSPQFKDKLYFLYLNQKTKSSEGMKYYNDLVIPDKGEIIQKLGVMTKALVEAQDLEQFESLVFDHEALLSEKLKMPRIQAQFPDYWGAMKSLGAWGGDFALVTSSKSLEETKKYFAAFGYNTLLPFNDLILDTGMNQMMPTAVPELQAGHVRQ